MADRLKKPLVILLAMGSNSGSHIGTSPLSQVTQNYSGFFGIITVIAGGNETGAAHHFYASILRALNMKMWKSEWEKKKQNAASCWSCGLRTLIPTP